MPLPPVRYISAGPMMPRANPSVAMAQGEALARMGTTIAAVGEKGFQIAERVRKTEEAGIVSAYFANLDEQAAQFSNSLLTRTDPDAWPSDWRDMVGTFKDEARNLKLSPAARAALDMEIQNWSTQRTIRMESLAAQRTVNEAQARIDLSFKHALSRGDREGAERQLSLMPGAGLMPSQVEVARSEMERGLARQALKEEAELDPTGTLDRLDKMSPEEFLSLPGNEFLTLEDRDITRAEAQRIQRQNIAAASDEFQDLAAAGVIRTEEDLEAHFAPRNLPPRVMEAMKADLGKRWNAEELARRATPEYQQETVGRVMSMLADYNPESADFDSRYTEMDSLVRTLPDGATKAELNRRLRSVREEKIGEFQDLADLARKDFEDLYKQRFFGETHQKQTLGTAIDDGFLRNHDRLISLGFSEDQAKEIIGKKRGKDLDPAEDKDRIARFRTLWKDREGEATADPYSLSIAQAIRDSRGRTHLVEYEDPEARTRAERELGKALIQFEQWLKQNPSKAGDLDAIEKEKYRILAPRGLQDFSSSILPPPVPGVSVDGSPGVLPPR